MESSFCWFCFVQMSYQDCFIDRTRLNGGLQKFFIIQFCSTFNWLQIFKVVRTFTMEQQILQKICESWAMQFFYSAEPYCNLKRSHKPWTLLLISLSVCAYLIMCCFMNVVTMCCFMNIVTSNSSQLKSSGLVFTALVTFDPIRIFAMRCKHNSRHAVDMHGCLFHISITTRHQQTILSYLFDFWLEILLNKLLKIKSGICFNCDFGKQWQCFL